MTRKHVVAAQRISEQRMSVCKNAVHGCPTNPCCLFCQKTLSARPDGSVATHWRVEVSDMAGTIVAIEPNMLTGRKFTQNYEATIREAARHLLSLLGDRTPY